MRAPYSPTKPSCHLGRQSLWWDMDSGSQGVEVSLCLHAASSPCLSVSGCLIFPMGRLLARLISKSLFLSRLCPASACGSPPLRPPARSPQASELGMTSAFYKYILTTMVRTPRSTPRPHPSRGVCPSEARPQASLPLLGPRTSPSCTWMGLWRTPPTSWASPCSTPRTPSIPSSCAASTCPGGRTAKPAPTQVPR